MIRIIKVCTLFALLFISCKESTTCKNINEIGDYILSLDNTRDELGIKKDISSFDIILRTTDDQFFTFPVDYLDTLYDTWGKKKKYSEFICHLVNEDLKFEKSLITKFPNVYLLEPDESEIINMNNLGLDKTVEYYSVSRDSEFYSIFFSNENLSSLIYYFYSNGFLITENDFKGEVIFIKPENLAN